MHARPRGLGLVSVRVASLESARAQKALTCACVNQRSLSSRLINLAMCRPSRLRRPTEPSSAAAQWLHQPITAGPLDHRRPSRTSNSVRSRCPTTPTPQHTPLASPRSTTAQPQPDGDATPSECVDHQAGTLDMLTTCGSHRPQMARAKLGSFWRCTGRHGCHSVRPPSTARGGCVYLPPLLRNQDSACA